MLIDFHTHTTASDGALSPVALLQRAVDAGVELLAITDHDTVAGYRSAAASLEAKPLPVKLVSGVEFSCRWSGATIHILGLGMNCDHPAMRAGLAKLAAARTQRGIKIGERLEALGFARAFSGAMAEAGESQLGRPHFAAWMAAQGHIDSQAKAFDKYLGQGKVGDVKAFWPELAEVVGWIAEAGGAPVIAHPLKYRFTRMKLRRLVVDFVAAGGEGVEVLSGRQTSDQTKLLVNLASEFELEASIGSDFHRDAPYSAALGVSAPFLGAVSGVWQRWFTSPLTSES